MLHFIICHITLDSFERQLLVQSQPQNSSAHDGQGGKSSGEPWNKAASDWFQWKKKQINVFLSGPVKFARERVNVWHVSGFSPGNQCCSKEDARLILETTFARLFRQNNWILQFYNNTLATYRKRCVAEWRWLSHFLAKMTLVTSAYYLVLRKSRTRSGTRLRI